MARSFDLNRRGVLQLAIGVAAAGLVPSRALAQTAPTGTALPARGEFVVRGGHVLTMDATSAIWQPATFMCAMARSSRSAATLTAPAAQVIDGRDMIVMPGFVDTHWHLWCTSLRLVVRADDPQRRIFPDHVPARAVISRRRISYAGVRLGVAEGLLSGITTVHDWSHNTVRRSTPTPSYRR